jgi:hypothetical protein
MALVMIEVMRGGLPALSGDAFMQLAFASQNPDRRPTPRTHGIEVSDEVEAVFSGRSRCGSTTATRTWRSSGWRWRPRWGFATTRRCRPM